MSAQIVNLNRARKAKARADKERQAAENRVRFGQTKAERETGAREREIAAARIDGHRRDSGETPEEGS